MNGYIYKITNLVNGKIYIGQTAKTLDERFKEHLYEAFSMNTMRPLYKAMRKYGSDNFTVELVEEVLLSELNAKECYYIKLYDCLAIKGNGYNITYGGEGKRVDYELVQQLWDTGLCVKEICCKTGFGRDAVRAALISYENYSNEESRQRGFIYQNTYCYKPVYQYCAQGQLIREFKSVFEAAAATGYTVGGIRAALEKPNSAAFGYQWSYYKFDIISPLQYKVRKYKQAVCEISVDGNVLNEFESASAAAKILNLKSDYIRDACRNKTHKYRKLDRYFKYKEEGDI